MQERECTYDYLKELEREDFEYIRKMFYDYGSIVYDDFDYMDVPYLVDYLY
jgi:hypothetical protein